MSSDETLIVVAAFDETHKNNWSTFYGGDVAVMDTSGGGHPTGAYIEAYRTYTDYGSYLFVQDSMRARSRDCVQPFRGRGHVVAWCSFPLFFDNDEQARYVASQYPGQVLPARGIFGPVFYATRRAMRRAEPFFPAVPGTKLEAQGTERAWAFAFQAAGFPVAWLYDFNPALMENGSYPPFTKKFANRQ